MSIEQIYKQSALFGLTAETTRKLFVPVIRFAPIEAAGEDKLGWSVLGRAAALPPGEAWPLWDASSYCAAQRADLMAKIERAPAAGAKFQRKLDRINQLASIKWLPLRLVAQVDMQQVRELQIGVELPGSGILSFFAEFDEGIACEGRAADDPPWRVFWFEDPAELSWVQSPVGLAAPRVVLRPYSAWGLAADAGYVIEQTLGFEAAAGFVDQLAGQNLLGGLQLGGDPLRRQHRSPRRSITLRRAGYDAWSPPADGLALQPDPNWAPLLQVATDFQHPSQWSGVASFWFKPGRWENGRQTEIELFYED